MNPIAFVTVGSYWHPAEAWIFRNRLADAGIDAVVADESVASMYWLYANAIGGVKVQVPREQVSLAQEVLARGKSDIVAIPAKPPADADQQVCPNCGSTKLRRERFSVRLVFLLWLILGVPIPMPSSAVECHACGTRFGPPTSFRFRLCWRHLLVFVLILALIRVVIWLTGQGWFQVASTPFGSQPW